MTINPNPYASPQSDTLSPGEAWLAGGAANLQPVYWGLSLIYWGIILLVVGFAVVVAGAVIDGRPQAIANVTTSPIVMAGVGMLLLTSLFWFVGPLLCLPAPTAAGARALIIAAVVMQLGSYVIGFVPLNAALVGGVGVLLWWAGLVAFVLFMRQLAVFIVQPILALRALRLLIVGLLWLLLMIAASIMIGMQYAGLPMALVLLSLLIGGLIVFVMFANLVNDLRKKIRSHLSPAKATPA